MQAHAFWLSCSVARKADLERKASDAKAVKAAAAASAAPAKPVAAVATAPVLASDKDYQHTHAGLLKFSESLVHTKLLCSARDHSAADALLLGDGDRQFALSPAVVLLLIVSAYTRTVQACGGCRC
jgi:hypothetical protein